MNDGDRHGRLTIVDCSTKERTLCRCDCGEEITVRACNLRTGNTTSCGCAHRDMMIERNYKHGGGSSSNYLFRLWQHIKNRCYVTTSPDFRLYGARGIALHEPWRQDFALFARELIAEIGERPDGRSLDRVDNDGNYVPGNLRWATAFEQVHNRRPRASA